MYTQSKYTEEQAFSYIESSKGYADIHKKRFLGKKSKQEKNKGDSGENKKQKKKNRKLEQAMT